MYGETVTFVSVFLYPCVVYLQVCLFAFLRHLCVQVVASASSAFISFILVSLCGPSNSVPPFISILHISGCNCAVAFCFPSHMQVSLRLDYVLYIQRTLEVAVPDHPRFIQGSAGALTAKHRHEVTVESYRSCSNCCTPCSICVLVLLSTES